MRDTYGVEIAGGEDELSLLAATVAIDEMSTTSSADRLAFEVVDDQVHVTYISPSVVANCNDWIVMPTSRDIIACVDAKPVANRVPFIEANCRSLVTGLSPPKLDDQQLLPVPLHRVDRDDEFVVLAQPDSHRRGLPRVGGLRPGVRGGRLPREQGAHGAVAGGALQREDGV